MKTIQSALWEIDLLPGWEVADVEDCCTITKENGCGALQISAFQKNQGAVTDDDLVEGSAFPQKAELHKGAWGSFTGFQASYAADDIFWQRWSICNGGTLLFVTYNCDSGLEDQERADVEAMISSLREPNG